MSTPLISADDHVDLTQDQVKVFLAPQFHESYDAAVADFGASMRTMITNETNQRWREQQGLEDDGVDIHTARRHKAAGRLGHTDAKARLDDMDVDGVRASVTYCEVSAFRYLYMVKDGWREATRAFNTALLEFASEDRDRLIISCQIPIHDIDAAVAEVKWAVASGCKSLQLPVFPAELGMPDYWDSRYDPLWAAISDSGLPICCHIGMNTELESLARRDPTPQKGIFVPMVALSAAESLGMWLLTGVFERFPDLKVVFVEPGVGWVSWWLDVVDDQNARQGYDYPGLKMAPSEYFRRNAFLTFIDEPRAVEHARYNLGINNILWSSDYPHPVSSWPDSQKIARLLLENVAEEERRLVLHDNAVKVWNL